MILKMAQAIANMVAKGLPITREELEFSFAVAEAYGDDAVWQQTN